MYLLAAATEFELEPARQLLAERREVSFVTTGVGPVESAFTLTRYLARLDEPLAAVVNFGVAGAYPGAGPDLLDVCLAREEILADLGICTGRGIEDLADGKLSIRRSFDLSHPLLNDAAHALAGLFPGLRQGVFLTVNCASGTGERGRYLQARHGALCENMEGAALARVCNGFGVAFFEVRAISNLVENRDPGKWRLEEACEKSGRAAAALVETLLAAGHGHVPPA